MPKWWQHTRCIITVIILYFKTSDLKSTGTQWKKCDSSVALDDHGAARTFQAILLCIACSSQNFHSDIPENIIIAVVKTAICIPVINAKAEVQKHFSVDLMRNAGDATSTARAFRPNGDVTANPVTLMTIYSARWRVYKRIEWNAAVIEHQQPGSSVVYRGSLHIINDFIATRFRWHDWDRSMQPQTCQTEWDEVEVEHQLARLTKKSVHVVDQLVARRIKLVKLGFWSSKTTQPSLNFDVMIQDANDRLVSLMSNGAAVSADPFRSGTGVQ